MTATNHALAGALIGLVVTQPVFALPLAFASHFVLDAIPHFGLDDLGGHLKARKKFHTVLYVDAILLATIFATLLIVNAPWLVFACAILAGSPDFVWAYRYVFQEKIGKKPQKKRNRFNEFHHRIQKSQTIKGLLIEVPFALVMVALISWQI